MIVPLRSLLIIGSSDESTMAARWKRGSSIVRPVTEELGESSSSGNSPGLIVPIGCDSGRGAHPRLRCNLASRSFAFQPFLLDSIIMLAIVLKVAIASGISTGRRDLPHAA